MPYSREIPPEKRAVRHQINARFDVRRAAAVSAGKLSATAVRILRRGGGTAFPGLMASRLDPHLVQSLSGQLKSGLVLVSGTNGKTTTSRMLAHILSFTSQRILRNKSGSNLMRGLASTLVREANAFGNLPLEGSALGLFEVDEAALPEVIAKVSPRALLMLNLFRDQLDRYGEVATIARLWVKALDDLPASATLVGNADDPLIANVINHRESHSVRFGIASLDQQQATREHASDVKACPVCGGRIQYDSVYLGHLGRYRCLDCAFQRPGTEVSASEVRLSGLSGSTFRLLTGDGEIEVHLPLPGLYNVYNALGAASVAVSLGLDLPQIASALATVKPAFGRMEHVAIDGKTVYLALAKNPAGLNQVLQTFSSVPGPIHLYVLLNDNAADGRDVSWIWDADIEVLQRRVKSVVLGGSRAEDIALRFKYAEVIGTSDGADWQIASSTERGFRAALELTPEDGTLFVIPTYTALLDFRGMLTRNGYVPPYWEE